MRLLFLSVLFLFLFNACASRYSLAPSGDVGTPTKQLTKKFRIAYLGFNTFKSTKLKNPDGTVDFEALSDPYSRTIKEPIGGSFPIPGENKPNGIRKDLAVEKVSKFVKSFLEVTGPTGIKELEKFLEISKTGENYTYSFKNLPYDYYIVGLHYPVFEKTRNVGLNFVTIFSSLFSVVTLGILPSYEAYTANTKVLVYDKNLNLLKELEYNNNYSVWRALWVSPNPKECGIGSLSCLGMFTPTLGTNPPMVFEVSVPKISADLIDFINTLK
ncbi:Lp29 family lipoprotein [Leptospira koniambonensis]|uniref:Lp29 family lipoprotein n=1 Tax=Leptospira koniambonensis TaxID=2484950 RepID=UPI003EBECD55